MQCLIDRRQDRAQSHVITGWWKDTGQLEDMLEANRLVLVDDRDARSTARSIEASSVEGAVVIEEGASLVRSVVRGPAVIGAGARIEDAYVGPFTAIADGVRIVRAEIEHSIVLAELDRRGPRRRMEASLIGREVTLTRSDGHAEDAAHAGRRQVRDQARLVKLLVTGAAGMLGQRRDAGRGERRP